MKIQKSFQYRLKPTKKQQRILDSQLEGCRWLYNELLSQRKLAFEEINLSLTKYQQLMFLPEFKLEKPDLDHIHSQVLQNVVDRLDKAFQHFFLRCKADEKPGFPRFRGAGRYNSFCYPQSGFSLEGQQLRLSKIGTLRIKLHRPLEGVIKTCILRKHPSGTWDVCFSCEVEVSPLPSTNKVIGVDVGLENFATFSDGHMIDNPKFFQKAEKALAKAQRKLSKLEKGTKKRQKQGKAVAKIHERIGNRRKDFCHKLAKKLVENYQYICLEELPIQKMVKKRPFAKRILDTSWNQFRQILTYKAEEAGRTIRLVNPAYTSQTCSRCKYIKPKKLSERGHHCFRCGYRTSRDHNAAENILALGLDGLGIIPRSLRL
jgi:putative transposase